MLKIFILLLNMSFAGEIVQVEQDQPVFAAEEYRCRFVSYNHNVVTHQFKWYSWETDRRCEYGIKVNDKVILVSTAFTHECQDFLKLQVQKGSLCLVNSF